jgi:uncharacterized membrane protein
MKLKISKPCWQALSLGMLSGMRTTAGPAIASHILSRTTSGHLAKSSLDFMQNGKTAAALKVFAAGELIGDKLPTAPDRIKPAGIVFRCIAGSLAGASVFKASGNNAFTGALIGSAAALGATFGSYYLRKATVKKFHLIDPLVGAAEDALVIGAGVGLIRTD